MLLALFFAEHAQAQNAAPRAIEQLREQATAILDRGCSRCHQDGKLDPAKVTQAPKGFGNILDLKTIIAERRYVIPGNPDNSPLWKQVQSGSMPEDVATGEDINANQPTGDEIALLAEWIKAEGEQNKLVVAGRDFISDDDAAKAMSEDLSTLPRHRVATTRYLSLVHLYNGGALDKQMEVYRQGAVKLLNSLNYRADPIPYQKLGPQDTLLRLNLDDMGWDEDKWQLVARASPFAVRYDADLAMFVEGLTKSVTPAIRADAFAFFASRPPLYHTLLAIPDTVGELEKFLALNINENIIAGRVVRAGFQKSGVSRNNRMIERHPSKFGSLWNSYDFAGNKNKQSLFLHPLGPQGEDAFTHDGGEIIYSLPNGMQAYMLATADGKRIDKGPTQIVQDPHARDLQVTNGISCMSCHAMGMRDDNIDEIRDYVKNSAVFNRSQREKVNALYRPNEELAALFERDSKRFQSSMKAAGLDPNLRSNSTTEMIVALSDHYERNLTRDMAAAELGMTADDFLKVLPRAGQKGHDLARRLDQDQVPRDQFAGLFSQLVLALTDDTPLMAKELRTTKTDTPPADHKATFKAEAPLKIEPAPKPTQANTHLPNEVAPMDIPISSEPDLNLISDRSDYKVNDTPVFSITTNRPCALTLVNVDDEGVSTMILPNAFKNKPELLKPHEVLVFPNEDDPFQIRLQKSGTERLIAFCSLDGKPIPGLSYNYSDDQAFAKQGTETQMNAGVTRAMKVERKQKASSANAMAKGGVSGFVYLRKAIDIDVMPN